MAASARLLSKEISDITECSLCLNTFTDPKVLPCGHTFCLNCLIQCCTAKNPGNQVANLPSCSLCRKVFTIPPGGLKNLPTNFSLNDLLLAKKSCSTRGPAQSQSCDMCLGGEIKTNAEDFCMECMLHLCLRCTSHHRIPKATTSHRVVSLADKPSLDKLRRLQESYCSQHPDRQIKFYCYDCKVVTCIACQVTKHSKHACSDIKETAEEFRKQLNYDIEKVTSCAQQSQAKLQQLERVSEDFLKNLAATQQVISAAYDRLKFLLDSRLSQLMEELNTIKTKRLKEIECKRDEYERQCMVAESFKKYCEEMKEKGTACDILRAANDLHTRSAELVKAQEQYNRQQLDRVELTFTLSPDAWSGASNLIGVLAEQQSRKLAISSANEFVNNAEVLHNLKCSGRSVWGIAQLGTELFVSTNGSEQVAVYDLNTYSKICHVTVSGLKWPCGLAACRQNNCLYISDYESNCIHRVDLSNGSCRKWSLNAYPWGVSLTKAFNLLVTLPQSIEEYTTSGSLIRSINLDASIDDAQHANELPSGQFVVSHWGRAQHRVCVVDTAGRIVHSYGGPKGSSAGQLDGPRSLAVDTRGYVFVTDCYNNRVQVLSPTLTRLDDVITPGHWLHWPCALHLDELNGRLYVGCHPSNVLIILLSVKCV